MEKAISFVVSKDDVEKKAGLGDTFYLDAQRIRQEIGEDAWDTLALSDLRVKAANSLIRPMQRKGASRFSIQEKLGTWSPNLRDPFAAEKRAVQATIKMLGKMSKAEVQAALLEAGYSVDEVKEIEKTA